MQTPAEAGGVSCGLPSPGGSEHTTFHLGSFHFLTCSWDACPAQGALPVWLCKRACGWQDFFRVLRTSGACLEVGRWQVSGVLQYLVCPESVRRSGMYLSSPSRKCHHKIGPNQDSKALLSRGELYARPPVRHLR